MLEPFIKLAKQAYDPSLIFSGFWNIYQPHQKALEILSADGSIQGEAISLSPSPCPLIGWPNGRIQSGHVTVSLSTTAHASTGAESVLSL